MCLSPTLPQPSGFGSAPLIASYNICLLSSSPLLCGKLSKYKDHLPQRLPQNTAQDRAESTPQIFSEEMNKRMNDSSLYTHTPANQKVKALLRTYVNRFL